MRLDLNEKLKLLEAVRNWKMEIKQLNTGLSQASREEEDIYKNKLADLWQEFFKTTWPQTWQTVESYGEAIQQECAEKGYDRSTNAFIDFADWAAKNHVTLSGYNAVHNAYVRNAVQDGDLLNKNSVLYFPALYKVDNVAKYLNAYQQFYVGYHPGGGSKYNSAAADKAYKALLDKSGNLLSSAALEAKVKEFAYGKAFIGNANSAMASKKLVQFVQGNKQHANMAINWLIVFLSLDKDAKVQGLLSKVSWYDSRVSFTQGKQGSEISQMFKQLDLNTSYVLKYIREIVRLAETTP